jgi:transposase
MDAFSLDLRKRVVAAYDRGEGSQAVLAKRFRMSLRTVERLVRLRRETGSVAPKPHGGGQIAKVRGVTEERLKRAVAETPDASLDELRDRCRVKGSRMCIFRALKRLAITRKKSR